MKIHYLEVVTHEVKATCRSYEAALGMKFEGTDDALGGAIIGRLPDGSMLGVRGLLSEVEEPVIRPYWLVGDIERAVQEVKDDGAEILHPPQELPDKGWFAIYSIGSVHHGLWQI